MRVVIVGCGKVGGYLARELRKAGKAVIGIDKVRDRALQVTEETGALTFHGDGTDLDMLEQLELRRSDFVVAVTGVDEENLVACQMAKSIFKVDRVLARLNDPRNRRTFEELQIPVVAVTDLMVQVISHEIDVIDLDRVAVIGRGEVSVVEVELPEDYEVRTTREIALPASSILVAIERPGEVIVPGADTDLQPLDRVLAVTLVDREEEVRSAILGPPAAPESAPASRADDEGLVIENGTGDATD